MNDALGLTYRDTITGMEGVVISVCLHMDGTTQYLIQPTHCDDGVAVEAKWFDLGRLTFVDPDAL